MKFVDQCHVDVAAGTGGNGSIAFRREKFIPFGGPSGGDGGRGGDVVFVTDEGLGTLMDITHARMLRAQAGEMGHGKDCYGKAGEDLEVRVPVGTQVFDRDTDELLFDLDAPGKKVVVAKGGKGGRGNIHFATPYDRAPRRAEPGEAGEEKRFRLELKIMADVGLLGFPNVGKSTFIRACSRAKPKVADYPFTTLTPHLGVVRIGDEASFVVADIPGLIPGASEGAGLGHRFLKHVERTRALLHLITLDPGEDRDPLADYLALRKELAQFDPELAKRPEIVAMSKADLPEVREAHAKLQKAFAKRGLTLRLVSAATNEGMRDLLVDLYRLVTGKKSIEDWEVVEDARPTLAATPKAKARAAPAVTAPPKAATRKKKVAAKAKTKPVAKPKAKAKPVAKKTAKPVPKTKAKAKAKPVAKPKAKAKPVTKKTAKKTTKKKTAARRR